jgi:hypothetical protein
MFYKPPIFLLNECLTLDAYAWTPLNQYHQLLLDVPFQNDIGLVCVFVTFIFNCYILIDSPHSYITKVHLIISTSSFVVSTPLSPIFFNLVFPFKWSKNELKGMLMNVSLFQQHPLLFLGHHMSTYFFYML